MKRIIEGILMAAREPVSIRQLQKVLKEKEISSNDVKNILNELAEDYMGRGIELKQVASGYRFQVCEDLSTWVNKLYEERPPRYSKALLETLALIAYKQPITRAEIEAVRGVAVGSNIVRTLLEHEWIKVVGHKDVPGRPELFATTNKFLDHFNLKSIKDMPILETNDIGTD